jgi:hypothetical protein
VVLVLVLVLRLVLALVPPPVLVLVLPSVLVLVLPSVLVLVLLPDGVGGAAAVAPPKSALLRNAPLWL